MEIKTDYAMSSDFTVIKLFVLCKMTSYWQSGEYIKLCTLPIYNAHTVSPLYLQFLHAQFNQSQIKNSFKNVMSLLTWTMYS